MILADPQNAMKAVSQEKEVLLWTREERRGKIVGINTEVISLTTVCCCVVAESSIFAGSGDSVEGNLL